MGLIPRAAASPACKRKCPDGVCHRGLVVRLGHSVLVDIGSTFVAAGAALGEEVDLVGDELAAVAFGAALIFPLCVVDAPFDRHELTLGPILSSVLTQAVEASDPVDSALLGGVAVFVLLGLAILAGGQGWPHSD